ncbi:uncharacterized protein BDW70DRAFT_43268 [Aspergillus foveolatus]|uniref:uncharacterized protein n=1 Tax=Aspergillus foveolatus TaxID=210207 RepID=UPI003CCD6259
MSEVFPLSLPFLSRRICVPIQARIGYVHGFFFFFSSESIPRFWYCWLLCFLNVFISLLIPRRRDFEELCHPWFLACFCGLLLIDLQLHAAFLS